MTEDRPDCVPCSPGMAGGTGIQAFGFRIGLSLVFAGQGMVFGLGYNNAQKMGEAPDPGSLAYYFIHGGLILSALAVAFLLGRPLLRQSAEALARGRISVEALFILSGFGAFGGSLLSTIRGTGSVYYEVVSIVFCVYAIGRQIGVVQKGRVAQAVSAFKHAFDYATVRQPDGTARRVPAGGVKPEDLVLIRPGDPIPVDGTIREGTGYIRETTLTGEPVPTVRTTGDAVLAGTWSLDGNFVVQPHTGGGRTIDRIIALMEDTTPRPSRLQETADRLMQFFVPVVSLTAAGTFLGWILFSDAIWWDALFNAMSVLLVACPCALGLAMPAGIWGGLYHLSQKGIVGRNGHLLDTLAECGRIVFDKTGTLTEFDLEADTSLLQDERMDRSAILGRVSAVAAQSPHPVSGALARLAQPKGTVTGLIVHPGQGLEATVDEDRWLVGERTLLSDRGLAASASAPAAGKPVYVACNDRVLGRILLRERLRPEVEESLASLQAMGCSCHILSGDPAPLHVRIAGLDVRHGLSPQEKVAHLEQWVATGERVLYIGDGVNDLPAMQACDASLAVELGAAMATEFADGLLVGGRVATLPSAVRFARRLKRSLSGNMKFALAYNLAGMALAAAGALHPVVAALLMVGSSTIVSLRALKASGV